MRMLYRVPEKDISLLDFYYNVALQGCIGSKKGAAEAEDDIVMALVACGSAVKVSGEPTVVRSLSATAYKDRVSLAGQFLKWYEANRSYLYWDKNKQEFLVDAGAKRDGRRTAKPRRGTFTVLDLNAATKEAAGYYRY